MRATLTSKGQITVPAALRRQYNLKAGDELDFVPDGPTISLAPEHKASRFAKYQGTVDLGIPKGQSVVEYVRNMRDGK
jgi:AbrB family looped-hinge helix DNA binding protein